MGDRGRKYGGGNSQQKFAAEKNIRGGDLHETDENDRTQKLLRRYTSKELQKPSLDFLNRVITFKKCPIFFQNWGGWDRIGPEGTRGPPHKNRVTDRKSLDA
jgi:hypothetical protein